MPATDTIILAASHADMLQTLTWPTLQQRRLKTKLIMFYKIVHHIVVVPTTILIPTDSRIRQSLPFTYRHLHAFKDLYKYSFFPNTIIYWNLLPQNIVLCPTVNTFREQITPTVLSSTIANLNKNEIVNSFNHKIYF
jgi:hypothetical protein